MLREREEGVRELRRSWRAASLAVWERGELLGTGWGERSEEW